METPDSEKMTVNVTMTKEEAEDFIAFAAEFAPEGITVQYAYDPEQYRSSTEWRKAPLVFGPMAPVPSESERAAEPGSFRTLKPVYGPSS